MIYYRIRYQDLLQKSPSLTPELYGEIFTEVLGKLPKPTPDFIQVDEGAQTIEISFIGEDLLAYAPEFRRALYDAFGRAKVYPAQAGNAGEAFEGAFSTPEAVEAKRRLFVDTREAMRKAGYKDQPDVPPPQTDRSDLENLKAITDNSPGLSFGGGHGDTTRQGLVMEMLDDDACDVDLFFIEELRDVDQKLLDEFLASDAGTPLPPVLQMRVKDFGDLAKMLEKMRDTNLKRSPKRKIKAYGIDSSRAKSPPGPLGLVHRTTLMNTIAKDIIDKALAEEGNKGKKFMAFVGDAHSNTDQAGVPGLAQLLGIPAVKLNEGRLAISPEDKTRRGMLSEEEFLALQKRENAIAQDPVYKSLPQKDKLLHIRQEMEKEKFETLKKQITQPFLVARKKIMESEQNLAQLRARGAATPEQERQHVANLTTWNKEIEDSRVKSDQLLAVAIAENPGLLKMADKDGFTLLHFAAVQMNPAAITRLVNADPSLLDKANSKGDTPCHLVLARRDFLDDDLRSKQLESQAKGLKALTDAGANLNLQNLKGEAPLHLAALNGNTKATESMLDLGAKTDVKDTRGWTPFDVCLGSTKHEVEQVFYDKGVASPKFVPNKDKPSIVDVLMQVTRCEDPSELAEVEKMYKTLYADPLLRPILEAAAVDAMQDRKPPAEGGLRVFITKDDSIGRMYNAPVWYPGGQGGYDAQANTFLMAGKPGREDSKGGTLVHEMTHMVSRKMFGDKTVPYADESERQAYCKAIEEDVKGMHLMSDSDPTEKRIRDRISDRMTLYANRGGDEQLMQEFIVGIPQLIAEFGAEVVSRYAPNLMKFYGGFTQKVAKTMKEDTRYQAFRDQLDNTALDLDLKNNPLPLPKAPQKWLPQGAPDLQVNTVLARVEKEFAIRHGEVTLPKGVSVAFSPDNFKIKSSDLDMVQRKLQKVRGALTQVLNDQGLASEVSPDALRTLVLELTTLTRNRPEDEIDGAVAGHVTNWVRDTKVRLTEHKIAQNLPVPPRELAEAVLLQAEDKARLRFGSQDPTATVEVDPSKHKALVKDLAKDLEKILEKMPEDKRKANLPALINRLSESLATSPKSGYSLKKKNVGTEHVSMDKKALRKIWLEKLASLK